MADPDPLDNQIAEQPQQPDQQFNHEQQQPVQPAPQPQPSQVQLEQSAQPVQPAKPPKKHSKLKWLLIVLFILAVAAAGYEAYTWNRNRNQPSRNLPQVEGEPSVQEIREYPDVYRIAGLPQYPGAEVTSVGRKEVTLDEGVSVILTTRDDVKTVSAFFETELAKLGWQVDSNFPAQSQEDFYYKSFTKDNTQFSITIDRSQDGKETTAKIGYVKK